MESGNEGRSITELPDPEEKDEEDATGENSKRIRASTPSARRMSSGAGGSTQRNCQVEDCTAELSNAKPYHRRHRACEFHAKASVVLLAGLRQRFCQQCSRFHEISEFDEAKRSCRRRLAGHNERRRKSLYESQ